MRDRHLPRVCRSCEAPLARQEDACWRCGTDWATEDEPRTPLRVIPGGAPSFPVAPEEHVAADRWMDEGGHP